ncbi:unnamed protein product, partial [Amoebophrya sp. A25]
MTIQVQGILDHNMARNRPTVLVANRSPKGGPRYFMVYGTVCKLHIVQAVELAFFEETRMDIVWDDLENFMDVDENRGSAGAQARNGADVNGAKAPDTFPADVREKCMVVPQGREHWVVPFPMRNAVSENESRMKAFMLKSDSICTIQGEDMGEIFLLDNARFVPGPSNIVTIGLPDTVQRPCLY